MTDWVLTFPQMFNDSQRGILSHIEKAGFEKGLQRASEIAATYALENSEADSLCREIAREIMAESGRQ